MVVIGGGDEGVMIVTEDAKIGRHFLVCACMSCDTITQFFKISIIVHSTSLKCPLFGDSYALRIRSRS